PDGVERPVLELGALLAAAADELLDHGAERAAAGAAQRGIAALGLAPARPILALAGAPPILVAGAPLFIAGAPPLIEAAGAPAILHASLPAILVLILALILSLILTLTLGLILPAALPAVLSLTLGVARAPPVVEARLAALTVAVIAVMAAAGVGARGHAHHQHRRKQQWRLQHGSRPRWSRTLQRASGRRVLYALRRALGALSSTYSLHSPPPCGEGLGVGVVV